MILSERQPMIGSYSVNIFDLIADRADGHSAANQDVLPTLPAAPITVRNTIAPEDTHLTFMGSQRSQAAEALVRSHWRQIASRVEFTIDDDEVQNADFAAVVVILSVPTPQQMRDNVRIAWEAEIIPLDTNDDGKPSSALPQGRPIALHTAEVPRFTGIYPGCVIGVEGTVMTRNSESQAIESVAVCRIRHPKLPSPAPPVTTTSVNNNKAPPSYSARIHFICGPFGNPDTTQDTLATAIEACRSRQADTLVICGPLVPAPSGRNVDHRSTNFEWAVSDVIAWVSSVVNQSGSLGPGRVIFVPSIEDVVCMPAMPQLPYDCGGEHYSRVDLATNPCLLQIAENFSIAVSSFDSVQLMQSVHLDRGYPKDLKVRQLATSVVRNSLLTPFVLGEDHRIDCGHIADLEYPSMPRVFFSPTKEYKTPIAVPIGGDASVFLSCGNPSGSSHTIMELTIINTADAIEKGPNSKGGVSVRTLSLN